MQRFFWNYRIASVLAVCSLVACTPDPYELSEDVRVSVDHERVALGASATLMIDVSADTFLQDPHEPIVESIEVEGDGKIRLDESDQGTYIAFDTLEPGPVSIRVNVSQTIDGMFGSSTRHLYNTVELEVAEVARASLTDPCVEDGVVRPRLFADRNTQYSYEIEVEDAQGRPLGGHDYRHGWVRDSAGTTELAPIQFTRGKGLIYWSTANLEPGPMTVYSERYGFELDTELHDPGAVDRLELGAVTTRSGHFYELPFRLFIGDSQVCRQGSLSVTGRVLTPEVCQFSESYNDPPLEDTSRTEFRFWRLEDGLCRVEVLAPWANGGEGLEEIVEFPIELDEGE